MIRLQKILHPTDFSETADNACRYACALAERFSAKLQILHAVETPIAAMPSPGAVFPPDYFEEQRHEIADHLAQLPGDAATTELPVERITREGTPFLEIIRQAKETSADLIVMGTHGRSGLTHLLIGSVAEKVVRKAPCPVLTVRPTDHQFVMP